MSKSGETTLIDLASLHLNFAVRPVSEIVSYVYLHHLLDLFIR